MARRHRPGPVIPFAPDIVRHRRQIKPHNYHQFRPTEGTVAQSVKINSGNLILP